MQIIGFFKWNQHLKQDKNEIIKSKLSKKELKILIFLTFVLSCILICILYLTKDKSPIIDGIATILSIAGMYLTVKRAIEQWIVWIIVNGITAIMWILILIHGESVYSAAFMWVVYFLFALYFFREWKREVV
jgi:nicotinamide mononucleotide transporter